LATSTATSTSELPAHSPLGPSSAERWLNCPASVRATRGLPDTDSDWSTEGTAAHTLSEWARLEDKPTSYWLGTKIPVEQVDGSVVEIEVDAMMVTAVQEFVDYVNQFDGEHLVEVRVYYDQYVKDGFGTLDHATLAGAIARVTDLKYGKGVQVFAERNEQLMCYALGIYLEHNWLYAFEEFVLTVHQPRLDHVDSWTISTKDLLDWAAKVLVAGYKATLDPNAPFNPGDWCKFCKIRGTCRARAAKTFEVLQGEFDNLDELRPTDPDILTNDELARARKHFPAITAWMTAVNAILERELLQGNAAGDLKLVDGRSSREFYGTEAEVVKALVKAGLKKQDIFEEPALKSVAKLEEVVPGLKKRFKPAGKKTEAGDLAHLIRKSPGKPTIADGSDPRPARTVNVADEFTKLEN
jgi:hypothetical protein